MEATLRMPPRCRVELLQPAQRQIGERADVEVDHGQLLGAVESAASPSRPKPALLTTIDGSRPWPRRASASRAGPSGSAEVGGDHVRAGVTGGGDLVGERVQAAPARRAVSTSAWPCCAKTRASAAPMPAEAPVIRHTGCMGDISR